MKNAHGAVQSQQSEDRPLFQRAYNLKLGIGKQFKEDLGEEARRKRTQGCSFQLCVQIQCAQVHVPSGGR